jgi:hypothetical protein
MRKLSVWVAGLLLVSMSAYAREIEVGTFQMSGATDLRYESKNIELADGTESDVWQMQFKLGATYYLLRNFGVGAYLDFAQIGLEDKEIQKYHGGPMVLYNYSLNERTSLFAKAAVGFLRVTADTKGSDRDGWEYMLGGGLRVFLTPTISLDSGLVFNRQEWDAQAGAVKSTDSQIAAEVGLSVYFGGK